MDRRIDQGDMIVSVRSSRPRNWETHQSLAQVMGAVIVGGNGKSLAVLTASDGRVLCYDCHSGRLCYVLDDDRPAKTAGIVARASDSRLIFHSGPTLKFPLLIRLFFSSSLCCQNDGLPRTRPTTTTVG